LSISELRQNASAAIDAVVTNQQVLTVMQRSKPTVVIVDKNYFDALEEAVLDATDAVEMEKAKKEPREPFEQYVVRRWGRVNP